MSETRRQSWMWLLLALGVVALFATAFRLPSGTSQVKLFYTSSVGGHLEPCG